MKILVFLKRVPDTATRVRIAADGKSLDPVGVEWVCSPYDEYAIEEAVRIKERAPDTEVVAVTLGPTEAQKELRTALAMGADRGIHLVDAQAYARDVASVGAALAAVCEAEKPDLALFGRQAVDDDSAAIGPYVACRLGWPALTFVRKLELAPPRCTVHREIEGAVEVVEATLPAVVTAEKGLNEPRFPSLKGIMAAKKKPIDARPAPATPARLVVRALELPPARLPGRIVGTGVAAVPELARCLRDEAKVL